MTWSSLILLQGTSLLLIGWPAASVWLIAVAGLVAILFLIIYAPRKQVAHLKDVEPADYFEAENEARRTLVQIVGGIFVVAGLFFTWTNMDLTQRNATEALKLSEKGQVTERFTRAVDQLGKSDAVSRQGSGRTETITVQNLPARLGGIISLEMIARESEDYHWEIMEILAAYVRRNAPAIPAKTGDQGISTAETPTVKSTSLDVEAAVTVIRRRNLTEKETDLQTVDLSYCSLPNASFFAANLKGASFEQSQLGFANFSQANLQAAKFDRADLTRALFNSATLNRAVFPSAQLRGANFGGANLEDANFIDAHLEEADLRGSNVNSVKLDRAFLDGTHLEGLDLRSAFGLKCRQIESAKRDAQTQLPPEITQQIQSGHCQ